MTTKEAVEAIETLAKNQGYAVASGEKIEDIFARAVGIQNDLGREALSAVLPIILDMDKRITPDTIKTFGVFGLVVHMNEDFERIRLAFSNRKRRRALKTEFQSLCLHSLLAILVDSHKWPK